MEKFLELLQQQIHWKKARPYILVEIQDHLTCQIEDNLAEGMNYEDAERNALLDMGDPVEIGTSLNRIHKPRIAWSVILLVCIISLVGILIHSYFGKELNSAVNTAVLGSASFFSNQLYLPGILVGILAMVSMQYIDYEIFVQYSRIYGSVILLLGMYGAVFGTSIHGNTYVKIGAIHIVVNTLFIFYLPIYSAILSKYRNTTWKGFLHSLVWLILPLLISLKMGNLQLTGLLLISMLLLLTVALGNGWFHIPEKNTIISIWSIGFLVFFVGMIFNGNRTLPTKMDYSNNYIFKYILETYGNIPSIAICILMITLIASIFVLSKDLRSPIGMLMGYSCGIVLALNTIFHIFVNLRFTAQVNSFLPFLSSGASNLMMTFLLMGLVMNIYRNKNIYQRKKYV